MEGSGPPVSQACQIPRSPCSAITRASRLAALRQLVSTARWAAAGSPAGDGADDRLMLPDRGGQLIDQGADIEPGIALDLGLDGVVQCQQARSTDAIDIPAVEGLVQIEDPGDGDPLAGFGGHGPVQLPQPAHHLGPLGLGELGGGPRREALEVTDDQHDLAAVLLGERSDHQPLLPSPAVGIDEAFLLEPMQRAADRGAAQAQAVGDHALGDAAAGRELSRHDELAELLVDPPDAVGAVVGRARRRCRARRACPGGPACWAGRIEGRHRPQAYRDARAGATESGLFGIPLWYFKTSRRFVAWVPPRIPSTGRHPRQERRMKTPGQRMPRRSRLAACLVAGAHFLLAFSGAAAQAGTGSVAGRVTDARSGLATRRGHHRDPGHPRSAPSPAIDGRYRIAGFPRENRSWWPAGSATPPLRRTVTVAAGQPATADFGLEASAYSLDEVVVTGTAGGEARRTLGNAVASHRRPHGAAALGCA